MEKSIMENIDVHTTVRIPKKWDEKIIECVDKTQKLYERWEHTEKYTKSNWIRDAIKLKIHSDKTIEELITDYNKLKDINNYSMYGDQQDPYYVNIEQEMRMLWGEFLPIFRHRPLIINRGTIICVNEMFGIQDKIDELMVKLNEHGQSFENKRTYTISQHNESDLESKIREIICKYEFEIWVNNSVDPSKILIMGFDGARWNEIGYILDNK